MEVRRCTVLLVAATIAATIGVAWGKEDFSQAEKALNDRFAGKMATAKIDIPIVRSLYVNPDGSFDEKRYHDRIKKFPTGLGAGEAVPLHRIEVKKDRICLCLDRQCGLPGFAVGRTTRGVSKRKTGRIEIEFARPLLASDVQPDVVLKAVSRVLSIEGELPPTDFDPSAILGAGSPTGTNVGGKRVEPVVTLLSVEVDPPQPTPGEQVKLVVHIEVSGSTTPLTIERQLFFAETPLLSAPRTSTQDWTPGLHRSVFELPLPATANPGVYTFRATVRGAGSEQSKEALFRIR